jgi:heat shock protein HslJ
MRRMIIGLAVGAVAMSLAACTATGGTGGTIDGTSWSLKSYDASGTATPVPAEVKVDAHFAGGRIAGSSGCNVYSGPATVSGATIKIGPTAGTQMACQGNAMTVEQAYLTNLGKAATFTATADALTMFDSSGKQILVYGAGAADPLEGSWNVTGYNNGKQAVVSPMVGTTLTADFTADSVAGSGGCNDYNGPYTLAGASVTIGPLAATRKACDQAIMDQETEFLTALQTPATVEVSGAIVTLRDASGATQVVLAAK